MTMTLAIVGLVALAWLALAAITALEVGAWIKEMSDESNG